MKTEILGVRFDDLTQQEAAQQGRQLLEEDKFHYVVTPNPEFLLAAEKDPEFRRVLNAADLVLPDGIGVVYSAKILGTPLKERVPGIEFAEAMLSALNEMGGRLYLLGAKPGVAEEAGRRICARYSDLVLCGTHDGYFKDEQAILPQIAAAKPDLLFVCLGAPKQEKWMARWGQHTGAKLAIGLGGCLDVFAGNVERAPERWQKLGLEWAYRLKKEPKRIGRMAKLPLVLVKAAGQRVHPGKPNKKGDRPWAENSSCSRAPTARASPPSSKSCVTAWTTWAAAISAWCSPSMTSPPPL